MIHRSSMVSRGSMVDRGSMVSRGSMDNRSSMVSRSSVDNRGSMINWCSMDHGGSMIDRSMDSVGSNWNNSGMSNRYRPVSTNGWLDLRQTLRVVYLRD